MSNQDLINRINSIINDVNNISMGGRDKRYIGSGMASFCPSCGFNLKQYTRANFGKFNIDEDIPTKAYHKPALQKKTKKPKPKPKGKQRNKWVDFVKQIQNQEGISYKEALQLASELRRQ